ncbi:hypothetical protein V6N13_142643 [Hibiscus sabdariffa]
MLVGDNSMVKPTRSLPELDVKGHRLGSSVSGVARQPEEVYGPWMHVVNRCRKLGDSDSAQVNIFAASTSRTRGSRLPTVVPNRLGKLVSEDPIPRGVAGEKGVSHVVEEVAAKDTVLVESDAPSVVVHGVTQEVNRVVDGTHVASKSKVVDIVSSLNRDKHRVVQVVVEGEEQALQERNDRVLPSSLRGGSGKVSSKPLVLPKLKSSSKARKNVARSSSNPVLAERLSTLASELDHAKEAESRVQPSSLSRTVSDPVQVLWHENTPFIKDGSDKMQE